VVVRARSVFLVFHGQGQKPIPRPLQSAARCPRCRIRSATPTSCASRSQHASTGAEQDNERLEFLGDAVLDLVVAEDLFRFHADLPEGDLTELKAWVVSRRVLAEAALRLELDQAARLGSGLRQSALPRSVLANLYEAVLGAVYMDGGLEAARARSPS
jgi:ribonuclease-3